MLPLVLSCALLWLGLFSFRLASTESTERVSVDVETENQTTQKLLVTQSAHVRESLNQVVGQIAPYPQSSLLSGIVLGDGRKIPYALKKKLQATSTIHMVVVSGQNLSILSGFLIGLVYLIGRRKTIVVVTLAVILYSLLTGLGVPVIRAAVMSIVTFISVLVGREVRGWWLLTVAAALMLLFDPSWLHSISFQLSFLATLGVIVVAPVLERRLGVLPIIIRKDLGVTIAAYLLTLPIISYNFSQISTVGILTNLVTVWIMPFVFIGGTAAIIIGCFSTVLGQIAALLPNTLLTYFIYVVEGSSRVPNAAITVGETNPLMWCGYYLILGSAIWALGKRAQNEEDRK